MAQTYAKMGRDEEASQLLRKVVAANRRMPTASSRGELLLSSTQAALELLQRPTPYNVRT